MKRSKPTVEQLLQAYDNKGLSTIFKSLTNVDLEDLFHQIFDAYVSVIDCNLELAEKYAEIELQIAKLLEDDFLLGRAWGFQGLVFYYRCDYKNALANYQKCEKIFFYLENTEKLLLTKSNISVTLSHIAKFGAALSKANEAEKLLLSNKDYFPRLHSSIIHNKGLALKALGHREEALKCFDEAISLCENINDSKKALSLINDKANLLESVDQYGQAINLLKTNIDKTVDLPLTRAHYHLNLGCLELKRSNIISSLSYFFSAREIFSALRIQSEVAVVELYLASLYSYLGMSKEAIHWSSCTIENFQNSGMQIYIAKAYEILASEFKNLGKRKLSQKYYTKCVNILKDIGSTIQLLNLKLHQIDFLLRYGEDYEIRFELNDILKNYNDQFTPHLKFKTIELLIEANIRVGCSENIDQYIKELEEISNTIDSKYLDIQIQYIYGRIFEFRGEKYRALNKYLNTINSIIDIIKIISRREFAIFFFARFLDVISQFTELCHELIISEDKNNILYLIQLKKLFSVLNKFNPQFSSAIKEISGFKPLIEKWQYLQSSTILTNNMNISRLNDGLNNQIILENEIGKLEYKILDLLRVDWLEKVSNSLFEYSQSPNIPKIHKDKNLLHGLQEAQNKISNNSAYIHYYIANGYVNAIVLTRNSLHVTSNLLATAEFSQILSAWKLIIKNYFSINNSNSEVVDKYLTRFYDFLVNPLQNYFCEKNKIFIARPISWTNVPFPAFINDGQFWVENFNLYYTSDVYNLNSLEKISWNKESSYQCVLIGSNDSERLNYSIKELLDQKKSIPSHWNIVTNVSNENDSDKFINHCQYADLIHISSHSIVRVDNIMMSWVLVGNSKLTLAEIQQLQLKNKPVMLLNFCENAVGDSEIPGFFSLANGFLAAGAKAVLANPWPIKDKVSQTINKEIYKNIFSSNGDFFELDLNDVFRNLIALKLNPLDWSGYFLQT